MPLMQVNGRGAADLIEQIYAFIWSNSEHGRVRRWLEQLPAEVVAHGLVCAYPIPKPCSWLPPTR